MAATITITVLCAFCGRANEVRPAEVLRARFLHCKVCFSITSLAAIKAKLTKRRTAANSGCALDGRLETHVIRLD